MLICLLCVYCVVDYRSSLAVAISVAIRAAFRACLLCCF